MQLAAADRYLTTTLQDSGALAALHASEGFYEDEEQDAHPEFCILCKDPTKATVLDIEFFCDKHWLFCNVCGRGIVKGLTFIGCSICLGFEPK